MAKTPLQFDVLVLGEHPCTYFLACLLQEKPGASVAHANIPGRKSPQRLVLLNPAFFSLHKLLAPLKRKLKLTGIWGVQFLSHNSERSEHRQKSIMAYAVDYHELRAQLAMLAEKAGVRFYTPQNIQVTRVDGAGLNVALGTERIHCQVLALGGELPNSGHDLLGLPEPWPTEILRRYSLIRLPATQWMEKRGRPVMPMSLNLQEQFTWAWLLPGSHEAQAAVEQPLNSAQSPQTLLNIWIKLLQRHGVLKGGDASLESAESIDLPLAGALHREIVANRTVLIGPAAGFYSATGEDIYPNSWSSIFAAEVIVKALKEPHLQDALQPYRHGWGSTLGDYLRGPQQNLRFLLPLVYRNPVMTTRLAEAIVLGRSVVR